MAADAENVRVAVGGAVYLAPVGTTGPTSAASTLDSAYKELGFWAEDGATVTPQSGDTTTIKAHTGQTVKERKQGGNILLEFPFIETSQIVYETFWDTTVDTADGEYVVTDGSANSEYSLVYETVYDDESVNRMYAPRVVIDSRTAINHTESGAVQYGITFKTLLASGETSQLTGWHTGFIVAGGGGGGGGGS